MDRSRTVSFEIRHVVLTGIAALVLPLVVTGCDAVLIGRELLRDDTTSAPPLEAEGVTAITDDEFLYVHPKWSPDGTTIAVSRNVESQAIMGPALSEWDVVLFDVGGVQIDWMPERSSLALSSPDWSPDGEELAMIAYDGDMNRILINGMSNQTDRELSCPSCDYPVWSTDGNRIFAGALFDSGSEDRPDYGILILDPISGEKSAELVLGTQFLDAFSVSADGEAALIADHECNDIWLVSFETGETMPFIDNPQAKECDPTFSADGTKIMYTVFTPEERSNSLIVANADGSSPQELLRLDSSHYPIHHPAWSPDGTRLAFVYGLLEVTAPSFSTLYVMDIPPEFQP